LLVLAPPQGRVIRFNEKIFFASISFAEHSGAAVFSKQIQDFFSAYPALFEWYKV
jgi:hypothetical protein